VAKGKIGTDVTNEPLARIVGVATQYDRVDPVRNLATDDA
jgi:hypothetical protein